MNLAPARASRIPMLGCMVVVAVALLLLSACGEGDTAASAGAAATRTVKRSEPPRRGVPCPAQVDGFLQSLRALRRELAVGLSYEQYAAAIGELQDAYDEIPVGRLTIDCLASAGSPAEDALNRYIDAANVWGECLADAACTTASVEPRLQRSWRVASKFLSEAR